MRGGSWILRGQVRAATRGVARTALLPLGAVVGPLVAGCVPSATDGLSTTEDRLKAISHESMARRVSATRSRDPLAKAMRSLWVSGSWRGEFEPCDCASGMSGGLARAATRWHEEFTGHVVVGPLLSMDPRLAGIEETGIRDVVESAGVHLVGASASDVAALGRLPDFGPGVHLVAANVRGTEPFALISMADGTTTGWTHVTVTASAGAVPDVEALAATRTAAASVVAELRPQCDFLLVTCEQRSGDLVDLIAAIPQADLVVSVGRMSRTETPSMHLAVPLMVPGEKGQDLVIVTPTNRGTDQPIARLEPLVASIPRDPFAWSRLQDLFLARSQIGLASHRWAKGDNTESASSCAECHEIQVTAWRQDGHARAWDALPDSRRGEPRCIGCHTTPVEESAGRQALLKAVQCTICHLVPEGHREAPATQLATTRMDCTRCHDETNAPGFDPAVAVEKIGCLRIRTASKAPPK